MDNEGKGIMGDPQATAEEIRQAWEHAALDAMREHLKNGEPVVTWDWENDRVLLVSPEEFAAPEVSSFADKTAPSIGE